MYKSWIVFLYLNLLLYLDLASLLDCSKTNYPYSLYLDRTKTLQLSWRVDYSKSLVYFRLTADVTPGTWFGVGFSDYGEPENADIAVFWTDAKQKHHFQVGSLSVYYNN